MMFYSYFYHFFFFFFFFFNDTATTEIYTLSLHDALPILAASLCEAPRRPQGGGYSNGELTTEEWKRVIRDRKSTRLNSSHTVISYAVFCLKKKKKKKKKIKNTKIRRNKNKKIIISK